MAHAVRSVSAFLVGVDGVACSGGTPAPTPAGDTSAATGGVTLSAPAARTGTDLRVLVYHDMEGLSGQDDYRTFNYSHPEFYAKGQEYLAGDINAVVDGLFAGGATKVEIVDAHGSGNPSPDLVPAKLDPRATQLAHGHRWSKDTAAHARRRFLPFRWRLCLRLPRRR